MYVRVVFRHYYCDNCYVSPIVLGSVGLSAILNFKIFNFFSNVLIFLKFALHFQISIFKKSKFKILLFQICKLLGSVY